ncbi:MAG: P-II family nitrogen regulator [Actinobacteria bacterium]|nr:P-II family nitrogen regulator [Actinomycetota bacterium]
MKKIQCVIRPQKLEEVKDVLTEAGIVGMTVTEVRGYGRQKGFVEHYRGTDVLVNLLPKVEIEIIVKKEDLERCIDIICKAAYTGEIGDGLIFVSPVDDLVRIRTGERGKSAL